MVSRGNSGPGAPRAGSPEGLLGNRRLSQGQSPIDRSPAEQSLALRGRPCLRANDDSPRRSMNSRSSGSEPRRSSGAHNHSVRSVRLGSGFRPTFPAQTAVTDPTGPPIRFAVRPVSEISRSLPRDPLSWPMRSHRQRQRRAALSDAPIREGRGISDPGASRRAREMPGAVRAIASQFTAHFPRPDTSARNRLARLCDSPP
jgi:hypothetical protein